MEDRPKAALGVVAVVQVLEFRLGEPWPVASMEIREDGYVQLKGSPGAAYGHLIAAARKTTSWLAEVTMFEALREAGDADQKGKESDPAQVRSRTGEVPTVGGGV